MPIFGNKLDIIVGNSGSTASLDAINFIYTNPTYGIGIQSSSIGALVFNQINPETNGAAGTIEFRLPSPENANTQGNSVFSLQATGSSNNPLVGIGLTSNQTPLGTLDIRSTTGSTPANLILRTNEDGIIEENEETGRIIFAIESSSILAGGAVDFLRSGSTAEIFSRVKNANSYGEVYGNLIVQVNDADSRTQPLDILELGYGASEFSSTGPAAKLSGSLDIKAYTPYVWLNDLTSTPIAYLGYKTPINFDEGSLVLYKDGSQKVELRASGNSYISSSYNLGLGTKTPQAKLHVVGNIFASGSITGSAISASGNISIGNRIGRGSTYIDFNPGITNEIQIVNNNTASLYIKANGNVSASSLLFASASEGPGSFTVITYNTSSGQFFFTSSDAVGAAGATPNLQQVTNESPLTTAAITASVFTASEGIFGNLIGTPNSNITASVVSSSTGVYGSLVGTPNSNITASVISASTFVSTSLLHIPCTTGTYSSEGLHLGNDSGDANVIFWDGTSIVNVVADTDTFTINNSLSSINSSFKSFGSITASVGISASAGIVANSYTIQNTPMIVSSSSGITVGSTLNKLILRGQSIVLSTPTTASIISSSNYIQVASVTASSANIIGDISSSAGHFLGVHRDGGGGSSTYLKTSGDAPAGTLKLEFGDLDAASGRTKLTIDDGEESIYATTRAGLAITPTSSGAPTHTGTDGQMVFGTVGGVHYMFVWMAGGWRSSSLS